jgi:hypothetical protein
MLDSIVVYLGLALAIAGLISLIRPMRFLHVRTRSQAAGVVASGGLLIIVALLLPVGAKRATASTTWLDQWMPLWQFDEKHVIQVNAPPEEVFAAIRAVRASEILFFRTLIAIRRCGQAGPESVLDAPDDKPLLDVATQTTFVVLTDDAPHELVLGTVVAAPPNFPTSGRLTPDIFQTTLAPGVVLATMNFLVRSDEHRGSLVSSETRVYADSKSALRRFAVYWRIIHPGSDIIRRMWLRAIKLRAEGKASRI